MAGHSSAQDSSRRRSRSVRRNPTIVCGVQAPTRAQPHCCLQAELQR
ncbi:hypothetical protein ACFPM0_18190 [Pseudonocardia sulfidoxydans]